MIFYHVLLMNFKIFLNFVRIRVKSGLLVEKIRRNILKATLVYNE